MRVPFSWIKEYIDWPGTVEELAQLLTMSGTEVEGIDWVGAPRDPENLSCFVVGKVLTREQHPNAAVGLPHLHGAQAELVGVGVLLAGEDLAHDEAAEVLGVARRADPVDALDLGARHRKQLGELLDGAWPVDVLLDPAERYSHGLRLLSELPQEADVVVVEQAQVGDAVLEHRHALDAQAEGEAAVLLGVVIDELVGCRVDHAGAHDLEPAGVLAGAAALAAAELAAHVDLDARLGEREEVRAHTDGALAAEELLREVVHGTLEIGERDALVDDEALDLVEHRRVRGVGVAAVDLAEADDVDGRPLLLHDAHLHGRGVGARH